MKKFLGLIVGLLLMISLFGTANAATIVDTGWVDNSWSVTFNPYKFAAEFAISDDYTITSMETFLNSKSAGSTATVVLYEDGGSTPGGELYSGQATFESGNSWDGIYNTSWKLDAGTYWASFEIRPGDTLMGSLTTHPPSPLGNEVWGFGNDSDWNTTRDYDITVRIMGDLNTVPIPGTISLLGLGLLGLAGVHSRKKQK